MADAENYLQVTFPFETRTVQGIPVRLYGHDGVRVIGALLDADGHILGPNAWYGDGYVWPPQPVLPNRDFLSDDPAPPNFEVPPRQTSMDDLLPPPAARTALIAAQQAIVDVVSARLSAAGDVPAELLANDRAMLAAAQAQITALSV